MTEVAVKPWIILESFEKPQDRIHFYSSYPGSKSKVSWLGQQKSLLHTLCRPHNTDDPGYFIAGLSARDQPLAIRAAALFPDL